MSDFTNPFSEGGAYGSSSGLSINNAASVRRMHQSPEKAIKRRLLYLTRQIAKFEAEKAELEATLNPPDEKPAEVAPKKTASKKTTPKKVAKDK